MHTHQDPHFSRAPLPGHLNGSDWTQQMADIHDRTGYWNSYYSNDPLIRQQPPSQFAAFVAAECAGFPLIVDVGCGNGRDTLFFAQLGHQTLGIDKSSAAIDQSAQKVLDRANAQDHAFLCMNALSLPDASDLVERLSSKKKVIYSRFFLHAITQEEQTAFLDFSFACMQADDMLALEFRTREDASREKVTGSHYRRYIDAEALADQLVQDYPGALEYFTTGTGLAKFRSDDAHVARILVRKV